MEAWIFCYVAKDAEPMTCVFGFAFGKSRFSLYIYNSVSFLYTGSVCYSFQ